MWFHVDENFDILWHEYKQWRVAKKREFRENRDSKVLLKCIANVVWKFLTYVVEGNNKSGSFLCGEICSFKQGIAKKCNINAYKYVNGKRNGKYNRVSM